MPITLQAFCAKRVEVAHVPAIERNELAVAVSSEVDTPFIPKGSPLKGLLVKHKA